MAHLRAQFEKELKNRLALKKQTNISDENLLLKTFKYYDLDNSGTVTMEQFAKVIDKLGFQIYEIQDIYSLYNLYSGGQLLNYRQFTQIIHQGQSALSRQHSPTKNLRNNFSDQEPEDSLLKLQKIIQDSEPGSLLRLCDEFNRLGTTLNLSSFTNIVGSYFPQQDDIRKLFIYLDIKKQGFISTRDFINSLRGPISYFLQEKLQQIFGKVSFDQKYIDVDLALGSLKFYKIDLYYDAVCRLNPKNQSTLCETFSQSLKVYFQFIDCKNKKFTLKSFIEFNYMFYFHVTDEAEFTKLVEDIWTPSPQLYTNVNLSQLQNPLSSKKKSQSRNSESMITPIKRLDFQDDRSQQNTKFQSQDSINSCYKIRLLLSKRGTRAFVNLYKQLRIKDEDNDEHVTFQEMKRGFADYHIDIDEDELKIIFTHFDANKIGKIPIKTLMETIIGTLNVEQMELVNEIFLLLDKDFDNIIQLNDLKAAYSAKYHPDVRKGRKSESEVLSEFLDSYEAHHLLYSSIRDPKITRQEFQAYYEIVAAIYNETEFLSNLKASFKSILDQPRLAQSQVYQNKSFVMQSAPFGTSDTITDYTTFLRPGTSNSQAGSSKKESAKKEIHAGVPSWPGYCLTFEQPTRQTDEYKEINLYLSQKLKQRGLRGVLQLLKAMLKQIHPDAKIYTSTQRQLTAAQLSSGFQELRINMDNKQIFELMGKKESTTFGQIVQNILGQMSDYRKNLVQQAFGRLSTNQITLDAIKKKFNPQNHPDSIKGVRNEDEILVSFLDTYDTHYQLYFENTNSLVTQSQFEHYYWCISSIIDDDRLYEAALRTSWIK